MDQIVRCVILAATTMLHKYTTYCILYRIRNLLQLLSWASPTVECYCLSVLLISSFCADLKFPEYVIQWRSWRNSSNTPTGNLLPLTTYSSLSQSCMTVLTVFTKQSTQARHSTSSRQSLQTVLLSCSWREIPLRSPHASDFSNSLDVTCKVHNGQVSRLKHYEGEGHCSAEAHLKNCPSAWVWNNLIVLSATLIFNQIMAH